MNKNIFKGILPAILWFVFSLVLLTLPGSAFPTETWMSKIQFDKIIHVVLFAVLVWLFCRAIFYKNILKPKSLLLFLLIFFMSALYGLAMEYVQENFIPNRSFDWGDVIADFVGGMAGYFISIMRYAKK